MRGNQRIKNILKKIINYPYNLLKRGSPLSNSRLIVKISNYAAIKNLGDFLKWTRTNKYLTSFLGHEFTPSANRIEIDITHLCSLKCQNCNRLINFAPAEDNMTVEQIKKFIEESIAAKKKWKSIYISGGEPTCHPQFLEITRMITAYKNDFSCGTELNIVTNGYEEKTKILLKQLPEGVFKIINSNKPADQQTHYCVTIAAQDDPAYKNADYGNACHICQTCAMGLNCYGYYPCTVSGAIDRIFGFNLGRKNLPGEKDPMTDLTKEFCRFCGHFRRMANTPNNAISPSWQKAIDKYKKSPPQLTRY